MEEKSEVEGFLNDTYKTKVKFPTIVPKYRKKKSKIELAGKQAMDHLIELAKTTDMTYASMAKRISDAYNINITKSNVVHFFRSNVAALMDSSEEEKALSKLRAGFYLEPNSILVKDIKKMDYAIEQLEDDEMVESDRKYKIIGDLLDKKGRLLLRHARLSGRLANERNSTTIDKMNVTILQQINNEKSDIMNRLKKAEFNKGVKSNEIEIIETKPGAKKEMEVESYADQR